MKYRSSARNPSENGMRLLAPLVADSSSARRFSEVSLTAMPSNAA